MRLIGIAAKPVRRGPMKLLANAHVTTESGLAEDCRGKGRSKRRQVTLLSFDQWIEACKELGIDLSWYLRRANLCITDVAFNATCLGKQLQIGEVMLQVTGETEPCSRMDEVHPGLKAALTPNWRGGTTCRVIMGGSITLGDIVEWV